MSWEPITLEELKALGRRIDSEYVFAENMEDLYRQLNENYSHDQWVLLRAPVQCSDKLIALLVKPRTDEED